MRHPLLALLAGALMVGGTGAVRAAEFDVPAAFARSLARKTSA